MPITPDILLDLDGVCADFTRHALRAHGWTEYAIDNLYANWPTGVYWLHHILGVTKTQFFKTIEKEGEEFWATIPEYPWTRSLIARLREYGPVTICTSPSLSPYSAAGKMRWMQKFDIGANFVLTSQKHLCANQYAILIDDHQEMCDKFEDRGGKAFLVHQPWNGHLPCDRIFIDSLMDHVRLYTLES